MSDLHKKLSELMREFEENGTTVYALSTDDGNKVCVDLCGDNDNLDGFFEVMMSWFGKEDADKVQKRIAWSLVKAVNRVLNEDSERAGLLSELLEVEDIDAFEEELVEEEEENDELDKMEKKFDELKDGICKLANLIEKLSNMLVETQDSKNNTKKK